MFIALLLLINSFLWNNRVMRNADSIAEIFLLIIFILLGYFIVFFGINSSSKNALLKQNMSTLKKQSDIYFNLANYDDLTGVASRQNIINQISKTLNNCEYTNKKCMIFMFDIDKFKAINDRYGHIIGDEALKYVSNKVKICLREDDLIGRFGGDEFIIFLKNTHNKGDAESLIKRIVNNLKQPLIVNGELIYIDISIGVSIFPTDSRFADDCAPRRRVQVA
jgi:diguanylate cyclase (GGDEF)-like protein